jgi:hypothetical protein
MSHISIKTVGNLLVATGFEAELMAHDFGLNLKYHFEFICECPLLFKEHLIKRLISKGRTVFLDNKRIN